MTLALAIPSSWMMGAAAITYPLLGEQGSVEWADFSRTATSSTPCSRCSA